MLSGFTGWHALVLLVIVVLLFGATKLPGLAKSVGQSMKIFKNEIKSEPNDTTVATPPSDGVQLNATSPEVQKQADATAKADAPKRTNP
jgi:sec-independent protein translocase protein TatA